MDLKNLEELWTVNVVSTKFRELQEPIEIINQKIKKFMMTVVTLKEKL